MSTPALTSTSYAVLGLLGARPCSTYELAQQMDRVLNRFWPRTRSKLFEEPKKLVAHGLARATSESIGLRPRTVYAITPAGRRALTRWVAEPGAGPVLEFEQLLKVFFAENGTTDDVRRTLADVRAWVHERTLLDIEVAQAYLDGLGAYPERAAINHLVGHLLDDLMATFDDWALWAEGVISTWPEQPSHAELDRDELARSVRRSRARAARYLRSGTASAGRLRG
ncbi:MAG: PadR family transcriptional regulator [Actinomycetota bacterium]|nr:PadR family transcriptional regulator [Actinomycetota bacterium]